MSVRQSLRMSERLASMSDRIGDPAHQPGADTQVGQARALHVGAICHGRRPVSGCIIELDRPIEMDARLFGIPVEQRRAEQPMTDHPIGPCSLLLGQRQKVPRQRAGLRTSLATRRYDHRAYSAGKMRGSLSRARQSSIARLLTSATASAPNPCSAIVGPISAIWAFSSRLSRSSPAGSFLISSRAILSSAIASRFAERSAACFCRFKPHLRGSRGASGLRQMLR